MAICLQASAALPTGLNFVDAGIVENQEVGTVVGELAGVDLVLDDTFSFELVGGEGDSHNFLFTLLNGTLALAVSTDFEVHGGNLSIRVKLTDAQLESLEQTVLITLPDNRLEDADGDGFSEADEEDLHGSSDTAYDTDGDGFGDPYEIANDFLPGDPDSHPPGALVLGWGENAAGQISIPTEMGDVVEIAAGASHSLALRSDGTVIAWGDNTAGQCDVPAGLTGVVAIGAGDHHSLAVLANGQVVGWGANEFGQITPPVNLADVVAVAGGGRHSIALKSDGRITVWGANDFFQSTQPVNIVNVVSITAARDQCMVVFSDGKVRSWGRDDFSQSIQPQGLGLGVMGATGEKHSLMLRRDGFIAGWGSGTEGQLSPPAGAQDSVAISTRGRHNLAIRSDRTVMAWGSNASGQTQVPFEARRAKRIAAGTHHSLVLRRNGNFPEISSPPFVSGFIGQPLEYQISVANATAGSYSAMVLPDGLALNSETGLISGILLNDVRRAFRVFANTDRGRLSQLVLLNLGDETPPTNVIITPPTVMENAPADSVAAALTATDPDEGAIHVFQLVSGEGDRDNYRFLISGNQLLVRYGIDVDFEKPHELFELRIRVTDSAGGTVEVPLEIQMLDDRTEDFDSDGLSEADEEDIYGTSDSNFDQDGDGIGDGPEVAGGTSPINPEDWPDYPVVAWGSNVSGTLQPPFAGEVSSISSGQTHGLALKFNGDIRTWAGFNTFGQRDIPPDVGDVVSLAAGGDAWIDDAGHSLALRRDGTVVAWGYDFDDQSTVPEGLTGLVEIAAGRDFNLALKQDGTVAAWGGDFYGQLAVPAGLTDVLAISAGGFQGLALKKDGTVAGWGSYFSGELWEPMTVPDGLVDVVAISAGRYHCLALRRDGTVAAWGNGGLGQTDVPPGLTGVIAVAAGGFHSLALKSDGSVVAWGLDDYRQSTPPGAALVNVRLIAAGLQHSIVIRDDPSFPVITSGREISAAVGELLEFPVTVANATPLLFSARGLPQGVEIDPSTGVISGILASPVRALVRITVDTDKGRLTQSAWISGVAGSAPTSLSLSPSEVTENAPDGTLLGVFSVEDADLEDSHTYQLVSGEGGDDNFRFSIEDGRLFVLGDMDRDFESQPGDLSIRVRGTDSNLNHFESILSLTFMDDRTEDADGDGLTEAEEEDTHLTSDLTVDSDDDGFGDGFEVAQGTSPTDGNISPGGSLVAAWGADDSGQTSVPVPTGELLDLAAGRSHSLGLRVDGTVLAWGSDESGQCAVPPALPPSVAIAAGGQHSLALAADGSVAAWGENGSGQCDVPPDLTNVIAISAGESHSIALRLDGTVVAWGGNESGQATVPEGLSRVIAVSAGGFHSLALLDDGTVTAWGSEWSGITMVPGGLDGVVGISAGGYHNLALKGDGTVVAWGFNGYGQTDVSQLSGRIEQVAAGWMHSLARKSDGTVAAWGNNSEGQATVPIEAVEVRCIAAGVSHSLALRYDRPVAEISEASRVRASVGVAVTQPVIVAGATPVAFKALGLPTGLSLDTPTGLQAGTISTGELRSVLLIVDTDQGRLNRILPYNTLHGLPPTAIQVNPPSVMENSPAGAIVATLSATDPDPDDTHTFTLVAGTGSSDNFRFLIEGNVVVVRYGINVDFDTPHADFPIRIRAVDAAMNEPYEQAFIIKLTNDWSEDTNGNGLSEAAEALVAWAGASGLTGDDRMPGSAPRSDGISNLVKYAFGLNPAVAYGAPTSNLAGMPALAPAPTAEGGTFRFHRRKNRGLIYQPRSSTTLVEDSFMPVPETPRVTWINNDWELVEYDLPADTAAAPRRFFCVKVLMP